MNADKRRSGETRWSEVVTLVMPISGAPAARQRILAIQRIAASVAFEPSAFICVHRRFLAHYLLRVLCDFVVNLPAPIFRYFPARKSLRHLQEISGYAMPDCRFRPQIQSIAGNPVVLHPGTLILRNDAIQGNHRPLGSRADFSRADELLSGNWSQRRTRQREPRGIQIYNVQHQGR